MEEERCDDRRDYAKKSTDEGDRSEDAKSVSVQIADARAYAVSEGWTVDDLVVFSDDGVSGAACTRTQRPAFFRLLDTLSPHPPFGVLVVTEQSRIGRDTFRTLHAIQQLHDAGVRVLESRKRREIKLDEDSTRCGSSWVPGRKIHLHSDPFNDHYTHNKWRWAAVRAFFHCGPTPPLSEDEDAHPDGRRNRLLEEFQPFSV